MQTQEILTLSSLSEAVLDKILAHDRWKLEQQLAHEKWVVEFNAQVKTSNIKPRVITSLNLSEDDVLINELTGYVDVILGNAKQKINELPTADAIFIGGTGGETSDIVKLCEAKLKQGGRIVIGTILVETLYSVLNIIEKLSFSSIDITQVTISKSRKTSTGTMFLARNPVTIISATKI